MHIVAAGVLIASVLMFLTFAIGSVSSGTGFNLFSIVSTVVVVFMSIAAVIVLLLKSFGHDDD